MFANLQFAQMHFNLHNFELLIVIDYPSIKHFQIISSDIQFI